jgi:hypothetical protein
VAIYELDGPEALDLPSSTSEEVGANLPVTSNGRLGCPLRLLGRLPPEHAARSAPRRHPRTLNRTGRRPRSVFTIWTRITGNALIAVPGGLLA